MAGGLMSALFWFNSRFPHVVLQGAGEGREGNVVLDGRWETTEIKTQGSKGAGAVRRGLRIL